MCAHVEDLLFDQYFPQLLFQKSFAVYSWPASTEGNFFSAWQPGLGFRVCQMRGVFCVLEPSKAVAFSWRILEPNGR